MFDSEPRQENHAKKEGSDLVLEWDVYIAMTLMIIKE